MRKMYFCIIAVFLFISGIGFTQAMNINECLQMENKKIQRISALDIDKKNILKVFSLLEDLTGNLQDVSALFKAEATLSVFPINLRDRHVLDISNFSFKELILAFEIILQEKLNCRDEDRYVTKYNKYEVFSDPRKVDPFEITFRVNERNFSFVLHYNGYSRSHQPGNYVIKEEGNRAVTWWRDEDRIHIEEDSVLKMLMYAGEVARRKVIDYNRTDGIDEYSEVPILCAIVAERYLRAHGIEEVENTVQDNVFQGGWRIEAAKEIINVFLENVGATEEYERKKILAQHIDDLLELRL